MKTYQVRRDVEGHLAINGLILSKDLKKIEEKLKVMGYSDYKKLPIRKFIEVNILEDDRLEELEKN